MKLRPSWKARLVPGERFRYGALRGGKRKSCNETQRILFSLDFYQFRGAGSCTIRMESRYHSFFLVMGTEEYLQE